ncbi:hypothetical protein BGZ46_001424 [Entomortierella lignicola]|nr:hypothetical protein BGZ46_001424 [Entomortierella lignicola]
MSNLTTIEDQHQSDSTDRKDQNKTYYNGLHMKEDHEFGGESSYVYHENHSAQRNSFRQSWTPSSLLTNSSSPASGRSLNSRHSLQTSSSSSSDLLSIHSFAQAPLSSASTGYRSNRSSADRRRQSRGHDGVFARPNSIVSIYSSELVTNRADENTTDFDKQSQKQKGGNHNSQKSTMNTLGSQDKKESNDAFNRICSLLTHLITDASTAVDREIVDETADISSTVGTILVGGTTAATRVLPPIIPLSFSESDSSDSESESKKEIQPDSTSDRQQDSVELDRDDRTWDRGLSRNRSRLFTDRNLTKRRSLFLELQSCEPSQAVEEDVSQDQDGDREHIDHQEETAIAEVKISKEPSSTEAQPLLDDEPNHNTGEYTTTKSELDSLLHPPVAIVKRLRRSASFPTMRSEMIEMQNAGELQQVIQSMDSELDRTVETIDGLTRDLVAIAAHQSWMQLNLERSSQFQTLQTGRNGKAYAPRKLSSDYFKQLSQGANATAATSGIAPGSEAPTSPTSYQSDFTRHYWDEDQSLTWRKEDAHFANSTSTTPFESPFQLLSRPKSTISTDDTVAGSEFGPGSPTPSDGLLSNRSFSKYFESLQTIAAIYNEPHMRKVGLIRTDGDDGDDEDDNILDGLGEYRGDSFHRDSISSDGQSSSCRTSALSLDGTIVSPLDTFSDYKGIDHPLCSSPPPQFSGTSDFLLEKEELTRVNTLVESASYETNLRIPRSNIPGSWPMSSPLNMLLANRDLTVSQPDSVDGHDNNIVSSDYLLQEDADNILRLVNAHLNLVLLVFWTAAYVIATVLMSPSLLETSSSRVRICMDGTQRFLLMNATQWQGEQDDMLDPIEEAMQLLKKSQQSIMSTDCFEGSKFVKDGHRGRALSSSGSISGVGSAIGLKSRRRLNHTRRRRDWIMGSSAWSSSSPDLSIYRGSPILRTMKFCSTASFSEVDTGSEKDPKTNGMNSGIDPLATLVD